MSKTQASDSNTPSRVRTRSFSRNVVDNARTTHRYEAPRPPGSSMKKSLRELGRFPKYFKVPRAPEASSSSTPAEVSKAESDVEEVVELRVPRPRSARMALTPPQTPAPQTSAASTFYVFLGQLRRPLGRHIETFHTLEIREVDDSIALCDIQREWNEVEKALTENGLSKIEWWVLKDVLQNPQDVQA